ncbi:unnamed protein product [Symbiodinium natans]|uniref:SHSP domain-containing protein n=1 Tax=Symbiodinium natans TaxID=878477 RepID=A0A812IBM3_9DINO|nr:unnamed protein product [Symbiodinium natans]
MATPGVQGPGRTARGVGRRLVDFKSNPSVPSAKQGDLLGASTIHPKVPQEPDVEEYSADSTEADPENWGRQSKVLNSQKKSGAGSNCAPKRCHRDTWSQRKVGVLQQRRANALIMLQDLDLQLDGDLLRLAGVARPTVQDAALLRRRLRREPTAEDYAAFGFGRFQEAIRVPADVDASKIQASCRNGQLQLLLPRRPRQFPRGCRTARPPMFPMW